MRHAPDRRQAPAQPPGSWDLLSRLSESAVDDDYARVAARRESETNGRHRPGWGVVVAVVLGLMISVAALQAQSREPTEARERSAVIEQIEERRTSITRSTDTLEGLKDEIASLQGDVSSAGASGESLLDAVQRSRILTGWGPVEGPGVRIVVDDADDAPTTEGGTVMDRDLQVLTNGLWQAGAEALSINGQRLGPTSAIRVAGQAITVNYRPLTPPYTATAIGDPDTLQARFSETAAGQSWFQLESNYGIRFDIESADDLTLPGVPTGRLRLRSAVPERDAR